MRVLISDIAPALAEIPEAYPDNDALKAVMSSERTITHYQSNQFLCGFHLMQFAIADIIVSESMTFN